MTTEIDFRVLTDPIEMRDVHNIIAAEARDMGLQADAVQSPFPDPEAGAVACERLLQRLRARNMEILAMPRDERRELQKTLPFYSRPR